MVVKVPGSSSSDGVGAGRPANARMRASRPTGPSDAAAGRFLLSLHVLGRARRLYQKDHPKIEESLVAAEHSLHEALAAGGSLAVNVERGQLLFGGRPLTDPRGELKALADDLLRRGVSALAFDRETHSGELLSFAELFENPPALASAGEKDSAAVWNEWLAERRIARIRVNQPLAEARADAMLPRILATVLEQRIKTSADQAAEESSAQPGEAGLVSALKLLDALVRILPAGNSSSAETSRESAREFERALSAAERPAVLLLSGMMDMHPPRTGAGETIGQYFRRLAEEMALGFSIAEFRAGRLRLPDLREHAQRLGRALTAVPEANPAVVGHIQNWASESGAADFELAFWSELTPKELNDVLRSEDAWVVPAPILRAQLDEASTTSGLRQARAALLSYSRCLLSPDASVRKATAAGLSDLGEALGRFWPEQLPEEFGRVIVEALVAERMPAVAALLVSVVERLAAAALNKSRYAEYEAVFQALEKSPQGAERDHLRLVERNLFADERWDALVSGALQHRPLDASLVRLLARDPERLLDRLSALLSPANPEAAAAALEVFPAMVRLVRTIGDTAIQALVRRAFDRRLGRTTAAVKLLGATRPQELLEVLPQAIGSWDWSVQDLAISELARQSVPGLSLVLLNVLPKAHLYVVPMIIDQMGVEGDPATVPCLVEIAAGDNERLRDVFIRIKAIEALGRMRAIEAALLLRTILRKRNGLTYAEPAGLRSAAEEALEHLEGRVPVSSQPEPSTGTLPANLSFARARRYPRYPLENPWRARIEGPQPAAARVRTISMGGACLQSSRRLQIGDSFPVEIKSGLKKIHPMAVVRNVQADGSGVEFIHMDSEDREKLRRILKGLARD
jgi:hypothetical protein